MSRAAIPHLGWTPLLRAGSVLVVLSTAGCGDYERRLPHGYSLVSTHNGSVLVYYREERRIVIHPNVDAYAVVGAFVVGHVNALQEHPDDPNPVPSGYFVVDTSNHDVHAALEKEEWVKQLSHAGIREEPPLREPTWLSTLWP